MPLATIFSQFPRSVLYAVLFTISMFTAESSLAGTNVLNLQVGGVISGAPQWQDTTSNTIGAIGFDFTRVHAVILNARERTCGEMAELLNAPRLCVSEW